MLFSSVGEERKVWIHVKTKQFSPEEISLMVLTKMRQIAESYLGKEVKNAVLTVPAYLTMLSVRQRRMLERLRD